ncbi:hypothetical protein DV737_g4742, partial [Chaetothyriales sp. CBS 132003]
MPFTDVPPSYDSSISRETWAVIAPYIPSADLCACCLVSRKWHSTFVPFLWGDPASHFGIANDAVYVALTRFKKTLRKARLSVRQLTHTLHLPPALSEIYGGPHATWLRDVLEYLPNLQSLIVTKLPFFDHHALTVLKPTPKPSSDGERWETDLPFFSLKLLLASSEPNTTSQGLVHALPRFSNLVYLDLSYTKPARDAAVLASLGHLYDLQALKLRGVGMRDGEAEVLANAIGIRVRLLDLRDNHLTDMAVRSLMQACFISPHQNTEGPPLNCQQVEDWPVGIAPGPDFFSLDTLRGEELDHELLKQLTNPLTGRLAFENIPHRGLTHLYISENNLSVEGLSSLLKSERLHLLDGGTADAVKTILRAESIKSPTGYVDKVSYPGAEKLVPVLAASASKNLTYLRVDHAVATKPIQVSTWLATPRPAALDYTGNSPIAAELPVESRSVAELPAPAHYAMEMPTSQASIFELDATPAKPRYELPGDIIHFAVSPPVGEKPALLTEQLIDQGPIRGDGPYAPEVANGQANHAPHVSDVSDKDKVSDQDSTNSTSKSISSPVSPATPAAGRIQPLRKLPKPMTPLSSEAGQAANGPIAQKRSAWSEPSLRQLRINYLLQQRPKPLASMPNPSTSHHQNVPHSVASLLTTLHPAALPNLRTLTLTNVPVSVPVSSPVLPRLKAFVSACAAESALSHLLAQTDYSLPPGRARHLAEQAAARRLFALRAIVLEMEQPAHISKNPGGPRAWEHSRQRLSMSKSSTGDIDSEALWTAAANDFSFFSEGGGEEEVECGIYDHEQDKYFPTAGIDEKMTLTGDGSEADSHSPRIGLPTGNLSPVRAIGRTSAGNLLRSPRELPLGRNRRSSNDAQRASPVPPTHGGPTTPELMGHSLATSPRLAQTPTSYAPSGPQRHASTKSTRSISPPTPDQEPQIDLIAELAKWRQERRAAFEAEMVKYQRFKHGLQETNQEEEIIPPFVEGHWKGEIRVVKNAAPKGRSGVVDMYGNYFEKGYLYP